MPEIAHICPSNYLPLRMAWLGPLAFNRRHLDLLPRELPGVYLLQHIAIKSGAFPVFYVGQSRDLHRRLAEHQASVIGGVGFFRGLRAAYFSAAHVRPHQLDDVERSLIQLLRPPANDRAPSPRQFLLPTFPPRRIPRPEQLQP